MVEQRYNAPYLLMSLPQDSEDRNVASLTDETDNEETMRRENATMQSEGYQNRRVVSEKVAISKHLISAAHQQAEPDLEARIEEMSILVRDRMEQNRTLAADKDRLSKVCQELEAKSVKLQITIDSLTTKNAELEQVVGVEKATRQDMQYKAKLYAQKMQLKSTQAVSDLELAHKMQCTELKARSESLLAEAERSKADREQLREKLETAMEQHKTLRELRQAFHEVQNENKSLLLDLEAVKVKSSALDDQTQALTVDLSNHKFKCTELENELARLRREAETRATEVVEADFRLKSVAEKFADIQKVKIDVEAEAERVKRQLEESTKRNEQLADELRLKINATVDNSAVEPLKLEIASLKEQLEHAQRSEAQARDSSVFERYKADEMTDDDIAFYKQIQIDVQTAWTIEKAKYQNEIGTLSRTVKNLGGVQQQKESDLLQMTEEIKRITAQSQKIREEANRAKQELEECRKELKIETEAKDSANSRADKLRVQLIAAKRAEHQLEEEGKSHPAKPVKQANKKKPTTKKCSNASQSATEGSSKAARVGDRDITPDDEIQDFSQVCVSRPS
ncbi:hypothetical protein BD324DRAFT_106718 [Kockovaella imperatae]|uniref:Uncharacterized protein n=1 Tax=Kockovaella imperatae TaxID=4999 RepID=A0A1Y1UA87_9TREE|nr:hypothetical protein BD324DRAFT_106718 [Kockovaella imperatae]ORX34938.1 hypothetical protein BD324DRAFT_106718 [Kockovaella imperatae]